MNLDARIEAIAEEKAGQYDLTEKEIEQPGVPRIKAYELNLEHGGSVELYDLSYIAGTVDVRADAESGRPDTVYEAEESFHMAEDLFSEAIDAMLASSEYRGRNEDFIESLEDGAGCVEIWEKISSERRDD